MDIPTSQSRAFKHQPPPVERGDSEPLPDIGLTVHIDGAINGHPIEIVGRGVLDEVGGKSDAELKILKLPDTVDPHSIGAYLFTGYPNACRSDGVTVNPFVTGSYHYRRKYSYSGCQEVTFLEMHCVRDAASRFLSAHFRLSGSMPVLGATAGVSPIYELWTPASPSSLRGVFAVAWLSPTGEVVGSATAISDYVPTQGAHVPTQAVHRYIDLATDLSGERQIRVRQDSFMLGAALSDGC